MHSQHCAINWLPVPPPAKWKAFLHCSKPKIGLINLKNHSNILQFFFHFIVPKKWFQRVPGFDHSIGEMATRIQKTRNIISLWTVKFWPTGRQLRAGDEEREHHPVSLMAMQYALHQACRTPFWQSRPYAWLFGFLGAIGLVAQKEKINLASCAWLEMC